MRLVGTDVSLWREAAAGGSVPRLAGSVAPVLEGGGGGRDAGGRLGGALGGWGGGKGRWGAGGGPPATAT